MDDLLGPEFRELIKQSDLGWGSIIEVDKRINRMAENVNNRGVAGYRWGYMRASSYGTAKQINLGFFPRGEMGRSGGRAIVAHVSSSIQ
jgi:hypothetical protein